MFSMRYTSPKVTPKRDVPSSLDVAFHQQHGERAQDNNTGDHGANSNSLLNDNVVPTQTTLLQPKLDNEEDVAEEASSSKNNLLQVSPTLTKDNIISSNGNQTEYSTSVNNNSSMSEIDSAVVNISDDIDCCQAHHLPLSSARNFFPCPTSVFIGIPFLQNGQSAAS